jgi:hypothetical protein
MSFAAPFMTCYWSLQIRRYSKRIARLILPELWESSKRKISSSPRHRSQFTSYAHTRAAQLAQPHIDEIMRSHPRLPAIRGNELLGLIVVRAVLLVEDAAARSKVACSVDG